MQTRYYFSGFDKEQGFPDNLVSFLKQDIQEKNKIVFIPSDFFNKDKIKKNTKDTIEMFEKAGFYFNDIVVLNENMVNEEMQEHIRNANVVFLMGGHPSIQLDIIDTYQLADSIRNTNAVVIGTSAGAMCMSKYSLLLPVNEKYPDMDIREAMNLSTISIYPHYNSKGEVPKVFDSGYEKTKKSDLLFINQKYGDFYLLPDMSEIREYNGKITFIGENIIYVSKGQFLPVTHS
ncbi:MAG: Type 1 glutamine amidotransferase-like domain-containing protein [Bacilli bacterium]|nr:Type 1 glutamine amidotransferase-like domain-containing protein [Bacilli bacterium]